MSNKLRALACGTPHCGDASFVCPVDVNDVLYRLRHATINKMKIWKPGKTWLMNASGDTFSEKTPKLWYHWNWEAHLGFPQSFGAAITRNYHEVLI